MVHSGMEKLGNASLLVSQKHQAEVPIRDEARKEMQHPAKRCLVEADDHREEQILSKAWDEGQKDRSSIIAGRLSWSLYRRRQRAAARPGDAATPMHMQ